MGTVDESGNYQDDVFKLLINVDLSAVYKHRTELVKVTPSCLFVYGKGGAGESKLVGVANWILERGFRTDNPWEITIPLEDVINVYQGSYRAMGAMHYDEKAVGVDVKCDGRVMNYAIFTKSPVNLYEAIERSRQKES